MSTLTLTTSDGSGVAFVRADVDSLGRAIVFGAASGGPTNNNSIRAFDGVNWEILWPNDPANGGVQQRHNGTLIRVPKLDELWIFGGSHLETMPGAFRSGRFHLSTKKWLAVSTEDSGAFVGVVKDGIGFHGNQAAAWSAELDMGIFFGGAGNAVYDDQWIIEPNPAGPEPYKLTVFTGSRPPARAAAQNLMVAVGSDFYLVGGSAGNVNNVAVLLKDFWKFDGSLRSWIKLSDPPGDCVSGNVTYDVGARKIVFWCYDKLYVYSLDTAQWTEETPVGLPWKNNGIGVYLPQAKAHFFEGGNNQSGSSDYGAYLITLSGGSVDVVTGWIAYDMPPNPGDGPSPVWGGSKHMHMAVDSKGRTWIHGGDYDGGPVAGGVGSYRNELWSIASPGASFELEYPYSGFPGDVQPARPDETGVWIDENDNFISTPGTWVPDPGTIGEPLNGGAVLTWATMKFDHVIKKWSVISQALKDPGNSQRPRFYVYDKQTKQAIGFGGTDFNVAIFHTDRANPADDSAWEFFSVPSMGTVYLYAEGCAIDSVNRAVYVADPYSGRLFKYNIDTRAVTEIGKLPKLPGDDDGVHARRQDFIHLAVDSKRGQLYYLHQPGVPEIDLGHGAFAVGNDGWPTIYALDLKINSWSQLPIETADGTRIRGNTMVYNEFLDCLFFQGGEGTQVTDGSSPEWVGKPNKYFAYWIEGAIVPPIDPPVGSTLKATFLGADLDKTGQLSSTPDGKADFHIQVSGLRSTPVKTIITSDTGGIWEMPFNLVNWLIFEQYSGTAGDLWFSQFPSKTFHVKVFYADGSTDETDAVVVVVPPQDDPFFTLNGVTYKVTPI